MMRAWVLFGVLFLGAVMVSGCGEDGPRTPEGACVDLVNAFGGLCVRCDIGSFEECRSSLLDVVGGDCANVIDIRDMDEFYEECIPWFNFLSCEEVQSEGFALDPSCRGQLLG